MTKRTCSIEDCTDLVHGRGWCGKHYRRWRRHGDPTIGGRRSIEERLWSQVDASGDCWEWVGFLDGRYGRMSANGQYQLVHRVAWELLVGPIPDGLTLDHLCRNRICVNPDHLEPVTHETNVLRGYSPQAKNARKTHCKRGHPFTEENTYQPPGQKGRICRVCVKERPSRMPACQSDNCPKPALARGLCATHYEQHRQTM